MTTPFARVGSRGALALLAALSLATGISACGSNDDQRSQQEQLDRARQEGARQAREQERIKQTVQETARLRREVERLKRRSRSQSSTTSSSGGSPTPAGYHSCGGALTANSATTCPFASNVRATYFDSGGASVIDVYSPVTNQSYTMYCSGGSPHVCTGGNNAAVSFP